MNHFGCGILLEEVNVLVFSFHHNKKIRFFCIFSRFNLVFPFESLKLNKNNNYHRTPSNSRIFKEICQFSKQKDSTLNEGWKKTHWTPKKSCIDLYGCVKWISWRKKCRQFDRVFVLAVYLHYLFYIIGIFNLWLQSRMKQKQEKHFVSCGEKGKNRNYPFLICFFLFSLRHAKNEDINKFQRLKKTITHTNTE